MLLPYLNKDTIEAGCDEAGRGCLAGAVYAASFLVDFTLLEKEEYSELITNIDDVISPVTIANKLKNIDTTPIYKNLTNLQKDFTYSPENKSLKVSIKLGIDSSIL